MKFLNWFFAAYWAVLAVLAFCGIEFSSFTIGCGFGIAAIGFFGYALRD